MPSFKNISKWIIFLLILYRNILDETRKTFFSFKPIDFLISIYIYWFCDVKFNPISMKKKQTSVRRHLNALPFISSLCFFILDFHWPSPLFIGHCARLPIDLSLLDTDLTCIQFNMQCINCGDILTPRHCLLFYSPS